MGFEEKINPRSAWYERHRKGLRSWASHYEKNVIVYAGNWLQRIIEKVKRFLRNHKIYIRAWGLR